MSNFHTYFMFSLNDIFSLQWENMLFYKSKPISLYFEKCMKDLKRPTVIFKNYFVFLRFVKRD